jgi:hypothetical protein
VFYLSIFEQFGEMFCRCDGSVKALVLTIDFMVIRMMKPNVLALALLTGAGLEARAATYTYTASTNLILNPERGLYLHAGPLEDGTNYDTIRDQGSTLCYSNIKLDDFRSASISASYLQEIGDAFSRMRAAGIKCVLRITYNSSLTGADTTLAWMETHLQQLQPVLAGNSDVIAFVQAGMIGAWGEWHSSSSGLDTPEGREAVYGLLCTYMPAGKFIQIRTPGYVNELVGLDTDPIDDSTAFSGTPRARIAHHNDAWVSSITDMGTYPAPYGAREALKEQIESHTKYAPWGGESAQLYDGFDHVFALAEAERFHATYLNATYNPDVINAFIAAGAWDEFKEKLGYRIELTSAVLPDALVAGSGFSFEIRLQNSGWAPFYNPRPVILRILSGSVILQEIELSADPRFWRPESGEIIISNTAHAASTTAPEHLGFALWMPDPSPGLQARPAYSVRFANDTVWDSDRGHNVLKQPASEPVDPPAPEEPIVIDGNFDDWSTREIAVSDPVGDAGSAIADVYAIWMDHDESYLYLRIQTDNAVDWTSSKNHLLFNLDGQDSNNYKGSEMMFESVTGYDNRGGFNAGGAISGLTYFHAPAGPTSDVEIRIPRSPAITYGDGTPVFPESMNSFELGFESLNASWAAQENVPYTEYSFAENAAFMTNQVIEHEPASGNIRMEWQGRTNSVIDLEASADLEDWSLLGRGISNDNGELLYIDHPPASEQLRFYRAKIVK